MNLRECVCADCYFQSCTHARIRTDDPEGSRIVMIGNANVDEEDLHARERERVLLFSEPKLSLTLLCLVCEHLCDIWCDIHNNNGVCSP